MLTAVSGYQFGPSMSGKAIDEAIQRRIPEKTRKTTECVDEDIDKITIADIKSF